MREKYLFIGIVFNLILSLEKKSCKNLDSWKIPSTLLHHPFGNIFPEVSVQI